MKFDYNGAKAAGYTDAEIADHLAEQSGFDAAGARQSGYSDSEIVDHIVNPPKSTLDQALHFLPHQAGLLTNASVKGATSLPDIMGNTIPFVANRVTSLYNDMAGGHAARIPYHHTFAKGADVLTGDNGQPQNMAERFEHGAATAAAGVATGGAAGADLSAANLANPAVRGAGVLEKLMSNRLPLQYQGAIGGSIGGGAMRESGASPDWQTAASIAGSLLAPGAIGFAKGLGGFAQPFYQAGRDKIVANTLATYADNPENATDAMKNAQTYVPGSPVTAGTASKDHGLIKLEKTLNQSDPNADQITQQNQARINHLNEVGGTPTDIENHMLARKTATEPLYQLSGAQTIHPDTIKPVLDNIDQAISQVGEKSDAGKTLLGMKKQLQQTVPQPQQVATGLLDASGKPIMTTVSQPTPLSNLVQIYKENRDNLLKSAEQPGAYGAAVKGVIGPVNQMLGQTLESANPIFEQAEAKFRDMSQPINQMQNMQAITKSLQNGTQDVNGYNYLSPAKVSNLMKEGQWNSDYHGWQPLDEALAPDQYAALNNVHEDLARSNLINDPAIRPAGSSTFNNMASSNALGNVTNGAMGVSIPGTKWLFENTNPLVKQNLMDTMQNPQKAAALLQQGTPNFTGPLLPSLFGGLGATFGAGLTYGQ